MGAWAWRHAAPLVAALLGLLLGAPHGAREAVEVGHAPAWAGWLAGAFLGIAAGLLVGQLVENGWRAWRAPMAVSLSRRFGTALGWLARQWTQLRRRITGHGVTDFQPYDPAAVGARRGPDDNEDGTDGTEWAPPRPPYERP